MDLKRLKRVIRSRWWVLVLVVVASVWIAGYLTELRNQRLPTREAVAPVSFYAALEDVTGEGLDLRLQEATQVATEANADVLESDLDLLAPWSVAEVVLDDVANQLLFIGRGETDAEAQEIALEMRQNVLDSGVLARPEEIEQQLDVIGSRMAELNGLIENLTTEPTPNPELDNQLALLDAELGNLQGRYGQLAVWLISPPPETTVAEVQAEIDVILERMLEIRRQQIALEPPPPPEQSLELTVYQLQYDELQTIYQDLFIRQLEVDSLNSVDPVNTFESTLTPVPIVANQALGLLAGLLIGVLGLVAADRARNPVWSSTELEGLTTLSELPPRGRGAPVDRPWYLATSGGQRKAGIQMLRATTESLWESGATLGIASVATQPEDIEELAADLAASIGISGKSVLLIDANFGHKTRLMELPEGGLTLSHLLRVPVDDADSARATFRQLLSDVPQVGPGLHSISAGAGAADPADIMSGRTLALIFDTAKELFDAVIVAGAETEHPITHVLSQRLDAMLLVGAAGKTTVSALETELRELSSRRARIIGLALLTRSRSRISRAIDAILFTRRGAKAEQAEDQVVEDASPEQPADERVRELAGLRLQGHAPSEDD